MAASFAHPFAADDLLTGKVSRCVIDEAGLLGPLAHPTLRVVPHLLRVDDDLGHPQALDGLLKRALLALPLRLVGPGSCRILFLDMP
jgi:hypothetical protein